MGSPADLYISADIEADGAIPGRFSMLSFGLAVAGRYDGNRFERRDPELQTFYRELRPISEEFDSEALEVAGLDRDELQRTGADPKLVMSEAATFVRGVAGDDRPVLVGFPVPFDWMFLYWYFINFVGDSPFDFSSALDMKSIFQTKAGVVLSDAGKDDLPQNLRSGRPHTHNALDDALEQADIFAKLFVWTP